MSNEKSHQIEIGRDIIGDGYRIIANDTSSRRPWMWYAPDLESAKLLAKTLCEQIDQDVTICKLVGVMRRIPPPVEFKEARPVPDAD